jgi:predicted secreted protein
MAETKVSGRDYLLFADIDDDATFKPVACLTSNAITSSLNVIDATSKCGDQFQPGPAYNQTIKADGFAIDQTGTPSKDSYNQLYAAFIAGTVFDIKMGEATPVAGNVIYTGAVFISAFDVTAADKEDVKFSATFTVAVPPLTQTVTA